MLGQIERGQSSPTITTLWKIATGLKVPLCYFLEEQQTEYRIADWRTQKAIIEDNGRMKIYPVFAYDPIRNVEVCYMELEQGCRHPYEKRINGIEKYLFVLQGKLELVIDRKTVVIEKKQAIRFCANVYHSYNNPYTHRCIVYNMISYPKA